MLLPEHFGVPVSQRRVERSIGWSTPLGKRAHILDSMWRSPWVYIHWAAVPTIWSTRHAANDCHWMNQCFLPCHIGLLIQMGFNTSYPPGTVLGALHTTTYSALQQPCKVAPLSSLFFRWRNGTELRWCISPKISQLTSDRAGFQTWVCLASESLFLDLTLTASGEWQTIVVARSSK